MTEARDRSRKLLNEARTAIDEQSDRPWQDQRTGKMMVTLPHVKLQQLEFDMAVLRSANEQLRLALERVLDGLPEFGEWDAEPLREQVREALGQT